MGHSSREQKDDQRFGSANGATLAPMAGTLHSGQESAQNAKGEERISVFWRVFGGTLLSIAALVGITLYQQFANSLNELRSNVNNLHESRGDLVKTEDFNSRSNALWGAIKEIQATSASVSALKERSGLMEQLLKESAEERKSLCRELQQVRERLAVVEARQSVPEPATASAR